MSKFETVNSFDASKYLLKSIHHIHSYQVSKKSLIAMVPCRRGRCLFLGMLL